jgi:rhodanese-related sulfurtransferase
MTVKLAFSMSSGGIFGAQVIGEGCISKPVDVIATCMQANMTVYDLEHLELAYAPPFGSAKSAVNMAGFVASNVLRGDTKIVHAEDLDPEILENYQVVDVRNAEEFANGCIRGAVLLPLDSLREQWQSGILDKYRKTLVYCQDGYRGYMAFRILHQAGFDVVNLDGGFKQLKQGGHMALIAQEIVK